MKNLKGKALKKKMAGKMGDEVSGKYGKFKLINHEGRYFYQGKHGPLWSGGGVKTAKEAKSKARDMEHE